MHIDFAAIEEIVTPRLRGGEKEAHMRTFADDRNRIMRGSLAPGASIGLHTHETSSEIIYILEGTGTVLYDGARETVPAGQCHYCPKGHAHSLMNNRAEPLVFFAVVPEQ